MTHAVAEKALSIISRYKNDDISPSSEKRRGYYIDKQRIAIYKAYRNPCLRRRWTLMTSDGHRLRCEHTHVLERASVLTSWSMNTKIRTLFIRAYPTLSGKSRICAWSEMTIRRFTVLEGRRYNILDFEDDFPDCTVIALNKITVRRRRLRRGEPSNPENRSRKKSLDYSRRRGADPHVSRRRSYR